MRNVPVWIDDTPIRRFPKLQKNITAEVLVVGAGVTGITTAYLLKKAGSTVALVEREWVASIDTGHTTAHLTYVTDVQLQQLVRNFGNDHAQAAWDAGAAAIDEIERIVEGEGIQCEFVRVPAASFFSPGSGRLGLTADADPVLDCYWLARWYHQNPEVFLAMPLSAVRGHVARTNQLAAELARRDDDGD